MDRTNAVAVSLAIPVLLSLAGLWFRWKPARYGSSFGYRTLRSLRSRESWAFAQRLQARTYTVLGIVLAAVAAAVMLVFRSAEPERLNAARNVLLIFDMAALLLTYIPIERQLKRHFDGNGNPRES